MLKSMYSEIRVLKGSSLLCIDESVSRILKLKQSIRK